MLKKQIKAGRILANLTQSQLCEIAGIPLITLRRVEGNKDHKGLVSVDTVAAIRKALEAQGVQFLENGTVSAGVGVAIKGGE